jgi:hypothetical protein
MSRVLAALLIVVLSVPALAATIGNSEDPFKIAVGARSMGMGGVYAAIVDGNSNMFNNPAGMYGQQPRLFSMSTSLLGDVNYLVLGGNWPLGPGSMGLGYAGSNVGSIASPTQSGLTYFDYHNNVTALSYAVNKDQITLGGRIKFFDQGFGGGQNYVGSGADVDLGCYLTPWDKTSLGLVLQNVLPLSLGGRINWQNGDQSGIPFIGRLGVASTAWRDNVLMAFDADFTTRPGYQSRLHGGAEWTLNKCFRLRGGLDQSYAAGGVSGDPTFGVGLQLGVLFVDYAYHPYHSATDALTHYFSLSFSADELRPRPIPAPAPAPASPEAKSVVPEIKAVPAATPEVLIGGKQVTIIKKRIFHYFSRGETFTYISNHYYGVPDLGPELAQYNNVKIGQRDGQPRGVKYIYIAPTADIMKLREQGVPKVTETTMTTTTTIVTTTTKAPATTTTVATTTTLAPAAEGTELVGPKKTVYHFPSSGDTLVKLSEKYYGSPDYAPQLAKINGIRGIHRRLTGKAITVPPLPALAPGEVPVPTAAPETTIAPETTVVPTTTIAETTTTLAPVVEGTELAGPPKTIYHYPSSGDTIRKIALKYYGTDKYAEQLGAANRVLDVNARLSGMPIKVPPLSELK